MIKENKKLILIFLIALGLRLMLFFAVGSWRDEVSESRIALADTSSYTKIALNLIRHKIFSRSELPPHQPELFYTPVYPIFLASIYSISGHKPYIPVLFQLLIGAATCLVVYKIGKILFDERTALLAGLFLAFDYSSIFYSNVLLTENLFSFLFIVHVLYLAKFLTTNSNKWLACSALFLGLSTLTRPVSVYFVVFLVVIFLAHFRKNLSKGILKYLAFSIFFFAVLAPWMTRNYTVSGKFLVSSAQEKMLDWSVHFIIERIKFKKDPPQEEDRVQDLGARGEKNRVATKKNTVNAVKSLSKRYFFSTLRFLFYPGSSTYPRLLGLPYEEIEVEEVPNKPWDSVKFVIQKKSLLERFIFFFCTSFLLLLYFTMCAGIYAAIRKNKVKILLLIIIIIIYFIIPSIFISRTPRYRNPIIPYVILLSCYGVVHLQNMFKKDKS